MSGIRLYLNDAAMKLSLVCDLIDENESFDLDGELRYQFQAALHNVAVAVDKQKAFYAEIEAKIMLVKQLRDRVTAEIKRYERIKERIVETTKQVIEANPGTPFRDSLGAKLNVLPNPQPRVVLAPTAPAGNQFSEYTRAVTKYEPDMAKIKEDLLAGKELGWAKLEYGTQLRGLKTSAKGIEE